MIVKEHTFPISIIALQALLFRLPIEHPKRSVVEEELAKRFAGIRGEQAITYFLNQLSKKEYDIYYDIRLHNDPVYFQVDVLVITSHVFIILEVKNIAGTLFFDTDFHQLIRTLGENEVGFPDPLTQVKTQREQLLQWLQMHGVKDVPIETLVVNANSSTILKTSKSNSKVYQKVIHAPMLIQKIRAIHEMYHASLSISDRKRLRALILRKHSPLVINPISSFGIQRESLRIGISCPKCSNFLMKRMKGTWICSSCKCQSKSAHKQAIIDYLLLFNERITNQRCRWFLSMSSRSTATNLLATMGLGYTGRGKGRVYFLPHDERRLAVLINDICIYARK